MVRRTFDTLPMPDRVLKLMNIWGKNSKYKALKSELEFLNRRGNKFEWDNEELDDTEGKIEQEPNLIHPDIIAEIPGVELESDYENIVGPALTQPPPPTMATRAAAARANASLEPNRVFQSKTTDHSPRIDPRRHAQA